jgi:hypothetical protein
MLGLRQLSSSSVRNLDLRNKGLRPDKKSDDHEQFENLSEVRNLDLMNKGLRHFFFRRFTHANSPFVRNLDLRNKGLRACF